MLYPPTCPALAMRSNALPLTALAALAFTACAGSPTEPAPVTPPPVVVAPPVTTPVMPPPAAPTFRARAHYAICARTGTSIRTRLPVASDTGSTAAFTLDSAGVGLVGAPITWVSRDSTIYVPHAGAQDTAGRIGTVWLIGTALGASDSVGVQVVASVGTDCR